MSQELEDDDLEPEYDFSGAVRGKYYQRYQQGTNVVLPPRTAVQVSVDVANAIDDARAALDELRAHPFTAPDF